MPAAFERVAEEPGPNRTGTLKTVVEGVALELHPMVLAESYSIGLEALINAFTILGAVSSKYESPVIRGPGLEPKWN